MSQLFTTELLPAADRIDAWRSNAQQICGDCRIKLPKTVFHGSIEVRRVCGLNLTRFSSSPLSFWKWPPDVLKEENRDCIVVTQLSGMREYLQSGLNVLLKPGDSTLIDAGRPWCSSCSMDCTRLYLRVPRWMMEDYLRTREIPMVRKISGTGLGATLCSLSQSLYDEAERLNEQQGTVALEAYFGILAACLRGQAPSGEHVPRTSGGLQLKEKIREFIDAHLCQPTIGPTEIASALCVSVRHLHRCFSATGYSVSEYIRSRRLQECRNDLANPRLRDKSITDIAFSWGFSDSAHFSRSFAKTFGSAPRDFRAQALRNVSCRLDQNGLRVLPEISRSLYAKPN